MKKYFFLFAAIALMSATCNETVKDATFYGAEVNPKNAITTDQLIEKMSGEEMTDVTLKGNVDAVCQVKGCWMVLTTEDGQGMRVTFKDYGFFVPVELTGEVVLNGTASVQVTSVEDLRHYAEDEGQSPEDIEAITEPLKEITFEATGVMPISK